MLRIVNTPSRASTGAVDAFLGACIKARRTEVGHTQDQVAAAMQALGSATWRPATVAACETGRRNLSLTEVSRICRALGTSLPNLVPLSMLFGDTGRALYEDLAPLIGLEVTYVPTVEQRQRYQRQQRLVRLEDAVLARVLGVSRSEALESGFIEHFLEAIKSRYGHDLLTERDERVASGEGSKTWVSRRLGDEVAALPDVVRLRRALGLDERGEES